MTTGKGLWVSIFWIPYVRSCRLMIVAKFGVITHLVEGKVLEELSYVTRS